MLLTIARWLAIAFPVSLLAGPAVAEIITILIAILFLVHSVRARDFVWAATPWVALLLLVSVMFGLSGLLSTEPHSAVRGIVWIRFPLLAAALAFWVLCDDVAQRRVLLSLALTVAFLVADMLLQYLTGSDIFGRARVDMFTYVRLTGPYSAPRAGISLIWIAFPAIFYVLDRVQARGHRLAGYAVAALFVAAVMAMAHFSGERMAFLYGVLGMALAVLIAQRLRAFFLVLVLAGAAALGLLLMARPDMLEQQVTRASREIAQIDQSIYGRLWVSSTRIVADHALTGVGPKQFRTACPNPAYGSQGIDDPKLRCAMHPHNFYLELATETGVISLLLFAQAVGLMLYACWKQRARVMDDAILCGLVIAFIIRMWPIASTPSHFAPWFASPMWLIAGLLMARLACSERAGHAR